MRIPEKVSVIIPAFNEEGGVEDVVRRVRRVLYPGQDPA